MPYDPLFLEAPPSPALCAELGIPAGAAVYAVHFPSVASGPTDRRAQGYQGVVVLSLDPDAEGRLPETWTPGFQPHRFRLARVRYREDAAYGEVRWSEAEGLYGQIRWPFSLAGLVAPPAERRRAEYGLLLAWGQVSALGRLPDDVAHPTKARAQYTQIVNAIADRLTFRTPAQEITQLLIAGDLHLSKRTVRYRVTRMHRTWATAKDEARQRGHTTSP